MCCLFSTLVKYVLIITNFIFILAGIGLVGLGVASLINVSDVLEIIPVNINAIPISIIVLGCVVFAISFCGCWGAFKQSQWLLFMYALCMAALAAGKIYLAIEIFRAMSNIRETVEGWVTEAFEASNTRPFELLEVAFRCCGTTGPASYVDVGDLPLSCCRNLPQDAAQCPVEDAFGDGCVDRLGSYFETFGDAIGAVLIIIIIFQLLAAVFGLFLCCCGNKPIKK